MNLKEWASAYGISYATARRWVKNGKMPVGWVTELKGREIMVHECDEKIKTEQNGHSDSGTWRRDAGASDLVVEGVASNSESTPTLQDLRQSMRQIMNHVNVVDAELGFIRMLLVKLDPTLGK